MMKENSYNHEDEIDLIELFKAIWSRKFFIIIFTAIITVIAAIYINMQTPIYEVKSVIEIGYLKSNKGFEPLDSSTNIEKKLKSVFFANDFNELKQNGIVSNIKASNKFIEVFTQALSNEIALEKNKQVFEYLQKEYQFKIDEFIQQTELTIKKIENKIKYVNEVEKAQLEQEIHKIKTQDIPKIEREIDFIKNIEIATIAKNIKQNQEILTKYESEINRISSQKSIDNSQSILLAMQVLNIQNLAINTQNRIDSLEKEKQYLSYFKLTDLEHNKENLENSIIRNEIKLESSYAEKTEDLQTKLELEKSNITDKGFKNTELVSDYITNSKPVKPKRSMTITVAFVFGLFSSIFIVLLMNFIRKASRPSNTNLLE